MSADDSSSAKAIAAWRGLLGAARVSVGREDLGPLAESTLAQAQSPAGVIKVGSKVEVVEAVRVAAKFGLPLYPISRGKNWGYGDACPVGPGQFVLDLSHMNQIVEVDPELAYAVVEPGVTQGQLHTHLQEHEYPLISSATGSSPEASVLGNLIERGFGMTPYSDHAGHVCGMEVVLADGRVIETGLGHYPNAPSRHLYKWGVGPHLDGLFTQSNLGIVVRAGIWLMARPEAFTTFRLTIESDADLEQAIDRLRRLRLGGTLKSPVFIANAFRTLAQMSSYPWERTGGQTPLPRETAESMLREAALPGLTGRWNAIGSLQGTRRGMQAGIRDVKVALRGLGRLYFTRAGVDVFRGVPGMHELGISRWRVRRQLEGECEDPTADGCGLYWIAPVCPARGADVQRCAGIIEEHMLARGFEPLVCIAMANDRAVFVTTLLAFDRREAEESRRADECHRELIAKLLEDGFPPYRAGVSEMDLLDPTGAGYWRLIATLKRTLDPEGILAPGRYDPGAAGEFRTAAAAGSDR